LHSFESKNKSTIIKEKLIKSMLIMASTISILTTFGILFSILFEAIAFFELRSFWYFLTGTIWSPGQVGSQFGAVPIFAGTFMITLIAMLVAVPIGLGSAIYMSEYASHKVRDYLKPILEILAGIPTVVYGFFAAITVAPLVVKIADFFGLEATFNSALASGVVMGIMIIPVISSLSDDVIKAVPDSQRKASLGLGMTQGETIKNIVLPSALPGIISATLLGFSKAIGETMIVVMAAGLRPNLSFNPLEDMTTVTVRIVDALVGDQAFNSPETLVAFALGLTLFVVTLILNIISLMMIRKFKEKYKVNTL
jgi:phosphate transport system permease protein